MGTSAQPSLWDDLTAWSKPTLLITGEQDGKFCEIAGEMAESLPHAAWVSMAEAGHTVHLEQPRQFLWRRLSDFYQDKLEQQMTIWQRQPTVDELNQFSRGTLG